MRTISGLSNGLSSGRGLSGMPSDERSFEFLRLSALMLTLSLWKASSTVSLGGRQRFVGGSESVRGSESVQGSLSEILVVDEEKFHRFECKLSIS